MIGPTVWNEEMGLDKRYFVVATSQRKRGFGCDQIVFSSRDEAEQFKTHLMHELTSRTPLLVHTFDDELDMAKWRNGAWPCEKTARLVHSIESEREATRPQ